jgi:hypothetical protein
MAVIKIKVYVSELDNVLSLFNKIQVQRSEIGTPFTDAKFITAGLLTPPILLGTVGGPYNLLQGKLFQIKVNGGSTQSITFTSVNPITVSEAAKEFNLTIVGAIMSDNGEGKPKITGSLLGTAGTLEIMGGAAASILGFILGQKDTGKDLNIDLLTGVDSYTYDDQSGEASYWYRTRYYDSISGAFSSWSDWIQGTAGSAIPVDNLIIGKLKLADIDGMALVGAKVAIVNVFNPLIVEGFFISGRQKEIETNAMGEAEITLIKGSTIDVILSGTSIIRRIVVPSSGTLFDLMDPNLVQDDPFQIQVPDLPAAPRST